MFRSSESEYSSLSSAKSAKKEEEIKVEAEIRKLNAAAKEFRPRSLTAVSTAGSDTADIAKSYDAVSNDILEAPVSPLSQECSIRSHVPLPKHAFDVRLFVASSQNN